MYKRFFILTSALLLTPFFVFAQQNDARFYELLGNIKELLNLVIPILIILALIYFFWGVIRYVITSKGNEEAQALARNQIVYGLLGIFVLLSIFGIINLIGTTLKISPGGSGARVVPYLQIDGKK